MGRGVENGILSKILLEAKKNGIKEIRANFIPTQKNKPAENFLPDFGFKNDGDYWIYKLNNEIKLPKHLKVKTE